MADFHQKLSQHIITRGRHRTESSSITFLWSQESWAVRGEPKTDGEKGEERKLEIQAGDR